MFKSFKQLGTMMNLMQLSKEHKLIVFFSESSDYWIHLSALVRKNLKNIIKISLLNSLNKSLRNKFDA